MKNANRITRAQEYASSDDFQQIFEEDMSGLYLLSFLLTADREKAEQCFVSGLEDAVEGNRVFKEWARSWARRTIIQNAVRVINPKSPEGNNRWSSDSRNGNETKFPTERPTEISAVLRLQPFERFVYVMSVLEGYSDQHCSVLLGCARWEVSAARIRALQQIGNAMDSRTEQTANASPEVPTFHKASNSVLQSLGLHTWRLQHN
jgi:DNA-directed RNA polymerase specialized sigma24 family protein